jgi:hypothetical protein
VVTQSFIETINQFPIIQVKKGGWSSRKKKLRTLLWRMTKELRSQIMMVSLIIDSETINCFFKKFFLKTGERPGLEENDIEMLDGDVVEMQENSEIDEGIKRIYRIQIFEN